MPPKRKNKAPTKPSTATPLSKTQTAGGIRTSSVKRRRSSVQGVKTSTSRLQPSEPLHMTTRHAAKAASSNTSPAALSVADGSSRRSSLNDVAHFQDDHSDVEDERPAKRSRVSTDSGSPPNQMGSYVSQTPAIETDSNLAERAPSSGPKFAGKKRRASDDSSESSRTVGVRPNGVLTRSESDLSEKQPRRKKHKTTSTPLEPAEAPPELTDGSTPPGSPEGFTDVAGSQGLQNVIPSVNGEMPAKVARRLPGRRRQPHSDINVEADLRRQLNIKMGYRSLAKIQKTFLEELSTRTMNNLENEPDFHQQSPEYGHIVDELAQRRQARLDQLTAERRLRLEELERVRIAEKHIQEQQYINRFKELQEDYLLQCFYSLKQLERQMKIDSGDATDDEENVIEPTRWDFPVQNEDDRIAPKFASRSYAYVETERLMAHDKLRRQLDNQRKAFMTENEDLNDSIESISGGFATFTGPDRTEALAHYQVGNLVEAAEEIERTPPEPEPPKVIPNEQAKELFLLASLSADIPPEPPSQKQFQKVAPPPQATTPAQQVDLQRQVSPFAPLSAASTAMSLETAKSSPGKPLAAPEAIDQSALPQETNGVIVKQEPDLPKNEIPARVSTHRIMDLLNDDQEVVLPKLRESQPPVHGQAPTASPSRQEQAPYNQQPTHYPPLRMDALVHIEDHPQRQHLKTSDREPARDDLVLHRSTSPHGGQFWTTQNPGQPNERAVLGDRRTPLNGIREILDRTTEPRDGPEAPSPHRESVDRPTMAMAPPLSRPFSPQEKPAAGPDSRRPSTAAYSASPSTAPLPYDQSPRDRPMPYTQHPRQGSYDQASRSSWDSGRRMSGSQAPPPPPPSQYSGSPGQKHYTPEYGRTGPTPPAHQSPYPPPSVPQLPPFSQPPPANSLPPKPPAPSSHTPINYRFAHYDPAPPRVPLHQPTSYTSAPHAPPPPAPAHPSHYPSPYSSQPPPFQGYIPPPGSFQAPPPPPPPPNANTPYPPLKIHQYGGQPILPANMAPPPPQSQGPMPPYGQSPPASAYSPQGPPPPRPQFEHSPAPPPPPPSQQERPEPQPRPRRQYRSYHAPGTEFRTYQGPNQRRRGG